MDHSRLPAILPTPRVGILFAQTHADSVELLLLGIGLLASLIILALVVKWLKGWYDASKEPPIDINEMLGDFRDMHEDGNLSTDEFKRIKRQINRNLGQKDSKGP